MAVKVEEIREVLRARSGSVTVSLSRFWILYFQAGNTPEGWSIESSLKRSFLLLRDDGSVVTMP